MNTTDLIHILGEIFLKDLTVKNLRAILALGGTYDFTIYRNSYRSNGIK